MAQPLPTPLQRFRENHRECRGVAAARQHSRTFSTSGKGLKSWALILSPTLRAVANVPWHVRKIPGGDLFAGWKPDVRFSLYVFDKLAECRDAMRLANDVGVQAPVREHVEVVDVVRIGHADDWPVNGVYQIRLIIIEIVAIGDKAEFLKECRRVRGAADRRRQPRFGRLADRLLIRIEGGAGGGALLLGAGRVKGQEVVRAPVGGHRS